MVIPFRRGLLLAVCASLSLAIAAGPARADLTPSGAMVSGASADLTFTTANGITIRCPTDLTGTIGSPRSISGRFFFYFSRCSANVMGIPASVTVTSAGGFTIGVTSSSAGVSASGDFNLDRGYFLTFHLGRLCDVNFPGPQGPFGGAVTFQQSTQTLTLAISGVATNLATGLCRGSTTTTTISGSFRMTPRITVS